MQSQQVPIEGPQEVRLYPLGETIPDGIYVFTGSSVSAREYLKDLSADQRAGLAVWTRGHIFTPNEFESERPGHEHDPIKQSSPQV